MRRAPPPPRAQVLSAAAPRAGASEATVAEAAAAFVRAAGAAAAAAASWPAPPPGAPAPPPGAPAPELPPGGAATSAAPALCGRGPRRPPLWERLLAAELPATAHLPLQRAAAHALSATLRLEQSAAPPALAAALGARTAAAAAGWDWAALCAPVLALRALGAQAQGGLWVRGGEDLVSELHYWANSRRARLDKARGMQRASGARLSFPCMRRAALVRGRAAARLAATQ